MRRISHQWAGGKVHGLDIGFYLYYLFNFILFIYFIYYFIYFIYILFISINCGYRLYFDDR